MPTPAIDTAALRLYYLQQLGVSVYVPKEDVVADAIAAAEFQDAPVIQQAPTTSTAENIGLAVPRQSLLKEIDVMAERPAPQVAGKAAATLSDSPASAQDEAAVIAPFQLLFCMPAPGLAVALQIPALAKPVLKDAEARLLQNLLRWLGIKSEGAMAGLLHFKWPLPGMSVSDAKTAGRNLQVFLQQAATGQPLQRLLVLGQGPAHCLEVAGADNEPAYQCWATHSLAEMLTVPELKREVWRQLLSLHAQL